MGKYCIFAFPHLLGSPSSYMTFQLLHSEFPYIWGKFYFLFNQCSPRFSGLTLIILNQTLCTGRSTAWTRFSSASSAGNASSVAPPSPPTYSSTGKCNYSHASQCITSRGVLGFSIFCCKIAEFQDHRILVWFQFCCLHLLAKFMRKRK